jgi:hypothetical protein
MFTDDRGIRLDEARGFLKTTTCAGGQHLNGLSHGLALADHKVNQGRYLIAHIGGPKADTACYGVAVAGGYVARLAFPAINGPGQILDYTGSGQHRIEPGSVPRSCLRPGGMPLACPKAS